MKSPRRLASSLLVMGMGVAATAYGADVDPNAPPPNVTVLLVGAAQKDETLPRRIGSLFEPETAVELRRPAYLAADMVLRPPEKNTVYLWVTLPSRKEAWIYASVREHEPTSARYLLQRIELSTGLDEVGSEMLAQIAHSSATALWAGLDHTERDTMARELVRQQPSDMAPTPRRLESTPSSTQRADTAPPGSTATMSAPKRYGLVAGAQLGTHHSGGEGWYVEPGLFAGLSYDRHATFHVSGAYLARKLIDDGQSRIRLHGALVEGRLGWIIGNCEGFHLRGELGSGVLFAGWRLRLLESGSLPQEGWDERAYLVGGLGAFSNFGPIRLGARIELRAPLQKTRYDVEQLDRRRVLADSWLSPGLVLEIGSRVTRW